MNIESYLFVRIADGASIDLAELVDWSRQNMATYKMPRCEIVAEFPLTVTGKVNKVDLSAKAAELVGSVS
ncbi:MAG: hypothetical protein ACLQUY_21505 [Ktedonobacterales bacterium]